MLTPEDRKAIQSRYDAVNGSYDYSEGFLEVAEDAHLRLIESWDDIPTLMADVAEQAADLHTLSTENMQMATDIAELERRIEKALALLDEQDESTFKDANTAFLFALRRALTVGEK